jgi:hypothetical protein
MTAPFSTLPRDIVLQPEEKARSEKPRITYKMRPTPKGWDLYDTLVPLTADQRGNLEYFVGQTNNCEALGDSHLNFFVCQMSQKDLERGATYVTALSIDKYMAINAAVMVGGFIGGFGATFLVPAALNYAAPVEVSVERRAIDRRGRRAFGVDGGRYDDDDRLRGIPVSDGGGAHQ